MSAAVDRGAEIQSVDAVIVGAGFAGLYMMYRLRRMGLTVQGVEAARDVGGTWYWNRYPGARCDVPSLFYAYTFSDELRDDWRWSEKYATQPEILAYIEHVANRFNLRSGYLFGTRVTGAVFDEVREQWTVTTDRGDELTAQWCIMATGCLSVPREPNLPGAERFRGEAYVTGLWPHAPVDFSGARVAMIGVGSSAIQSAPLIAKQAARLTVFQRTPNYSLPARNRPLEEEELAAFTAMFPQYKQMLRQGGLGISLPPPDWTPEVDELRALADKLWSGDALLALAAIPNVTRNEVVNKVAADYVREKIRDTVKDPALAEVLTPKDYPIGSKRPCVDTDYYQTFNRENVDLVDLRRTPIEEITETGVRTIEREYPADRIVYAIGFDAMTGALLRMNIRGRSGEALRDAWAHGPRTYLGLQVAGFPNLFTITGPGSPSVLSNMLASIEQHVDWIADAIQHMRTAGRRTIEPRQDMQDAWVAHVNEEAEKTLYPRAASWYLGANVPGKPRVFMPYVGPNYRGICDEVVAKGYDGFVLA